MLWSYQLGTVQTLKNVFRSCTMPELLPSQASPEWQLTKSHTSDSLPVDDTGDKVSDSGTYTIDEDNKELEKAREDIDEIFGVKHTSIG